MHGERRVNRLKLHELEVLLLRLNKHLRGGVALAAKAAQMSDQLYSSFTL